MLLCEYRRMTLDLVWAYGIFVSVSYCCFRRWTSSLTIQSPMFSTTSIPVLQIGVGIPFLQVHLLFHLCATSQLQSYFVFRQGLKALWAFPLQFGSSLRCNRFQAWENMDFYTSGFASLIISVTFAHRIHFCLKYCVELLSALPLHLLFWSFCGIATFLSIPVCQHVTRLASLFIMYEIFWS